MKTKLHVGQVVRRTNGDLVQISRRYKDRGDSDWTFVLCYNGDKDYDVDYASDLRPLTKRERE